MKIVDLKLHVRTSPLAEPFAFSQGWVHMPDRPGLGIEVNRDVIRRSDTLN